MVTSDLNESCFLSISVRSICEGKLSDSSNIEGPAAGGDESCIFRTASDSSDFGNESITFTVFNNTNMQFPNIYFRYSLFYNTRDQNSHEKYVLPLYLFLLKNTWIKQFLRKSDYKRVYLRIMKYMRLYFNLNICGCKYLWGTN